MAGFRLKTHIDGSRMCAKTIGNSQVVRKGSFGIFTSGLLYPAAATDRLAFFVVGLVDRNGIALEETELAPTGTFVAGEEGVGRYTAASDNATVDQVKALGFYVTEYDVYSSAPDATIGTTTGSDLDGYFTDLANAYTVDENVASTSAQQLAILGLDPLDSTRGLYMVAERNFAR